MKLRIVKDEDHTCCFELFNKTEKIECGDKAVARNGGHKYLCREHTEHAMQFAEEYEDTEGDFISSKEFYKLLEGETHE